MKHLKEPMTSRTGIGPDFPKLCSNDFRSFFTYSFNNLNFLPRSLDHILAFEEWRGWLDKGLSLL